MEAFGSELTRLLTGLQKKTPRAIVKNTNLLGYTGSVVGRGCNADKLRCEDLHLHLAFVVQPYSRTDSSAPSEPVKGIAKVVLRSVDNEGFGYRDVVKVDVDLDSVQGLPEASQEAGLADIVYAVQSLDSVVMDRLNNFLWEVERTSARDSSPQAQELACADC